MTTSIIEKIALSNVMRVDPPRIDPRTRLEEERVRVRVSSASDGVVIAGAIFNAGEREVEVYASQVAELERAVETWLREPQTVRSIETRLKTHDGAPQLETREITSHEDETVLPAAEREARIKENKRSVQREFQVMTEEFERATSGTGRYERRALPSEAAAFRIVMKRDMRPLVSVELLDAKAPAGPDKSNKRAA